MGHGPRRDIFGLYGINLCEMRSIKAIHIRKGKGLAFKRKKKEKEKKAFYKRNRNCMHDTKTFPYQQTWSQGQCVYVYVETLTFGEQQSHYLKA